MKFLELSEKATAGVWTVHDMHGTEIEPSRFQNGAFQVYANSDCEYHAVADFSANHTCKDDTDCRANADFVVALVNAFRNGDLIVKDARSLTMRNSQIE